jgi:hypothetical protein
MMGGIMGALERRSRAPEPAATCGGPGRCPLSGGVSTSSVSRRLYWAARGASGWAKDTSGHKLRPRCAAGPSESHADKRRASGVLPSPSPGPPPPEVTTSGAVRHWRASMKRTVILTRTPGRGDPEAACPSRPGRVRPQRTVRKEPSGWIALKDPISIPLAQASL